MIIFLIILLQAEHDSKLTHTSGATLFHVTPRYVNVIAKHRPKEGKATVNVCQEKAWNSSGHLFDPRRTFNQFTTSTSIVYITL